MIKRLIQWIAGKYKAFVALIRVAEDMGLLARYHGSVGFYIPGTVDVFLHPNRPEECIMRRGPTFHEALQRALAALSDQA